MTEYINKEQLLAHLYSKQDEPLDIMKEIAEFPAADVVPKTAYEQVAWECDLAVQQLRTDYVVGLGEKKANVRGKELEAAIKSCEDRVKHLENVPSHHYGKRQRERAIELERVKIAALRPVSREQVEKVWKGCEYCCGDVDDRAYIDSQAFYISGEGYLVNGDEDEDICQLLFCPKCGSPLTDEAVEIVMERLEALK